MACVYGEAKLQCILIQNILVFLHLVYWYASQDAIYLRVSIVNISGKSREISTFYLKATVFLFCFLRWQSMLSTAVIHITGISVHDFNENNAFHVC